MKDVVITLLEISVYAAILWAGTMAFKKVAGDHMSAKLGLAVWSLLLVRLLCPVTFDTGLHLFEGVLPPQTSVESAQLDDYGPTQRAQAGVTRVPETAVTPHMEGVAVPVVTNARTMRQTHVSASIYEILGVVWIAGMVVMAAVAMVSYMRLRWHVAHEPNELGRRLREVFSSCCSELGIRKKLWLLMSDTVHGPALLIPGTVLYPSCAETMNEHEMRMSMLHELMHYKRRDSFLLLLLMALRTVYWFNPIVWLMMRQIREDMEAACDSDVISGWPQERKANYARTILLLYGAGACKEGVASFAVTRSARQAEQRIRRIFMKKKSSGIVRLAAIGVAGALALICFTTACLPTKAKSNDVQVISSASANPDPATDPSADMAKETQEIASGAVIPAPISSGSWKAQMALSDGTVDIDAQQFVPVVDALPIYSAEHTQVTPEMVSEVAEALWGDAMPEFQIKPIMTKERRDAIVEEFEKLIRKYEQEGPDPDETISVEARIAARMEEIANTEKLYQDTMAEDSPRKADYSSFYYNPHSEVYGFSYDVLFADGAKGTLCATPPDEDWVGHAMISYQSEAWEDDSFAGFTGSMDDVVAQASALATRLKSGTWMLADAGKDPMLDYVYVNLGSTAQSIPFLDGRLSSATEPSMMTADQSAAYERGEFELPKKFAWEELQVCFDDTGMIGFFWKNPWTITGIVEENPEILSIEDAQQIFVSSFDENNGDGIPAGEIVVDRVELGYAYCNDKDEKYCMIPVYDFIGSSTWYAAEGYPLSFMRVNALDGSI